MRGVPGDRIPTATNTPGNLAAWPILDARGMKKGDLARFVEEAVRWRVLEETAEEGARSQ